jgi:hypothetical protein
MMIDLDFAVFIPIAAILASACVITSVLRYKQSKQDAATGDAERQAQLLAGENERLRGQIGRLEERLSVLERIATDPSERTAREIESLR